MAMNVGQRSPHDIEDHGTSSIAGHLFATTSPNQTATISINPAGSSHTHGIGRYGTFNEQTGITMGGTFPGHTVFQRFPEDRSVPINDATDRLPCVYSTNPTPLNNRLPLPYEPQGYMHIFPRDDQEWRKTLAVLGEGGDRTDQEGGEGLNGDELLLAEQVQASPAGDFVSHEAFEKIVGGFKGGDGKFLAMTAYGAVPLPDQMLQTIPEKFVTKPLIQEREVFVLKQDHRTRVTERDFTQFEHRFIDVPKALVIDKIKAVDDVKIIDVPHYKYKPVVEDKIIEIPQGIKYVEVPIEVPCRMPPRIVPVPKPHIVERIIETTKPVVQEKIIEVPEIVKKKVPKIVTKDIPYVVPRYVEKIVEVPYQPGQQLPEPQGAQMTMIPKPPPLPGKPRPATDTRGGIEGALQGGEQFGPGGGGDQYGLREHYGAITEMRLPGTAGDVSYQAPTGEVCGDTLVVDRDAAPATPQTFYLSQGIKHIKLPYEARIDVSIIQEEDLPDGAPIAQKGVRYMAPGSRAVAYGNLEAPHHAKFNYPTGQKKKDDAVYAGPMDPVIEHAPPGMRAIEFRTRSGEPDILTQQGVLKYSKFECCLREDAGKLLPNLPQHDLVPMDPPGTPNLKTLTFVHSEHASRMNSDIVQSSARKQKN